MIRRCGCWVALTLLGLTVRVAFADKPTSAGVKLDFERGERL